MTERKSGRDPEGFSRDFARKLNGVIGEAEKPPTGQQMARALRRNDGYVSERKNGKRPWTVDDVDVIAGLLGTDGLELMSEVLRRMEPARAKADTSDVEELTGPRHVQTGPRYGLEDLDDPSLPRVIKAQILERAGVAPEEAERLAERRLRVVSSVQSGKTESFLAAVQAATERGDRVFIAMAAEDEPIEAEQLTRNET